MDKTQTILVCETFRDAVMLSINSMAIDASLKANLIIRFQTFYLSMLQELLDSPPPPPPNS